MDRSGARRARDPSGGGAHARLRGPSVALGALLALGVACKDSSPAAAPSCRLNSDCPLPQSCFAGRCVDECREDRDCPHADEVCDRGACVPKEPVERLCRTGLDCELDEACRAGVCTPVSLTPPDAGTSSPDAAPSDGGSSDGGSSARDGGVADAGGLPYGAVCTGPASCASMLCLGPSGSATGRCTKTCNADGDCFYPDHCVDVPGAGKFCGQNISGKAPGESCPGGPTECSTGLCLTTAERGPICTEQCAPLPVCPSGLACAPVADGSGGAVTVCTPGNGRGFGDGCARASECAAGLCLGLGGTSGVCTAFCDQTPCPTGWACAAVSDGAGGQVRICAPSGAAGGDLGASCAAASDCSSGLCLSDARTGSAFCTIACTSEGDCSPAGLTCVALASGEQVCGPP